MANYSASLNNDVAFVTQHSMTVPVLSAVSFGTGAINTAVITDCSQFRRMTIALDITGANTGGVSAAWTMACFGRLKGCNFWAALSALGTFTNTAYIRNFNFEGGAGFSGYPAHFDEFKLVITNGNTGTGAGITAVTGTVNLLIGGTDL